VTEARAKALSAEGPVAKGEAENQLSGALKSVFAVAEAYPQLRAVESFASLQAELADTENKIQAARRFYNGNVRDLNIKIESFPSNIVANLFKFEKREFFELEEGNEAKEPVQVKF
jgi:LemA protein